jgi:hypothetical protein
LANIGLSGFGISYGQTNGWFGEFKASPAKKAGPIGSRWAIRRMD